ncbi:MAG: rRNA pseudouridine synthase [Oscillospiraceae bacterium]|nr:rRNA pseudouridine synthase [Oscillospiraceae bacterium]
MAEIMRLDKFIASQRTDLSRKDVKELCKKVKITVNDALVKQSDVKIDAEKDKITVDGVEISYNKYIYIMLNKPQGVVCSTRDGASPTVLSLLPPELNRKGLFPAGRLDKDTEGFVLITDDGDLAHRILSPKNHVDKKYYVELLNPVGENYTEAFSSGMEIDGGDICKPAQLIPCEENKNACYVILHEGMFHQIKRMFEKLGNKVTYLKRISIGGLTLDENLALGECLVILHKDVEKYL